MKNRFLLFFTQQKKWTTFERRWKGREQAEEEKKNEKAMGGSGEGDDRIEDATRQA